MKQYKVSYYEDGVKHSFIISATNKYDALTKAWSMVDVDDVSVSEVKE